MLSLVVDSLTDSPRKTSVYTLAQKKKMPIDIKPSPHGHIDIEMHFIQYNKLPDCQIIHVHKLWVWIEELDPRRGANECCV